jgi:hypothetical protein
VVEKKVPPNSVTRARGAKRSLVFGFCTRWHPAGALLVVCQILLLRDRALRVWTKIGTGMAVLIVLLLSVGWFRVTNGEPPVPRLQSLGKHHTVTLTWRASTSPVAGYNVYHSTTHGADYVMIYTSLIQGPTYTDKPVNNGVTYYYVTRAEDARGYQSLNSNETSATVPFLW